jgi:hypothetical protein
MLASPSNLKKLMVGVSLDACPMTAPLACKQGISMASAELALDLAGL